MTKTMHATCPSSSYVSAPELFGDGAEVDERCDVYSFGMIAWEMFTGEVPWKDQQPMQIAMKASIHYDSPEILDP